MRFKERIVNGISITEKDYEKAWINGISSSTLHTRLKTGNYTLEEALSSEHGNSKRNRLKREGMIQS